MAKGTWSTNAGKKNKVTFDGPSLLVILRPGKGDNDRGTAELVADGGEEEIAAMGAGVLVLLMKSNMVERALDIALSVVGGTHALKTEHWHDGKRVPMPGEK